MSDANPAVSGLEDRLRVASSRVGGPESLAQMAGIPRRTLGNYLAGRNEPKASALAAIAGAAGVSVEWLVTGNGAEAEERPSPETMPNRDYSYPVLGLAHCGLQGWFREDPLAVEAELRLEDPTAFAVMSTGDSLRPEGIRPGYLCFCSPRASRKPGDLVFVERNDGTASIKRLVSESPESVVMEGWLPPENGTQSMFREEIKKSYLKRVGVVVYVKRKL